MIIVIETNEPAQYTYTQAVQLTTGEGKANILYLSGGYTLVNAEIPLSKIIKFATYESPNS